MSRQPVTAVDIADGRDGERGSGGVFLVVITSALLMMIGLSFDGGRILAERREAIDVAHQAALAGTQGVATSDVRQGNVSVNPQFVAARANAHLAAAGYSGTVTVTATEVTVTVTTDVDMQILSAIGIGSKTVTGTATSRLVRGVEGPDT